MGFICQLCGRRQRSLEWDERIPYNPREVEEQIHQLERLQAEIRSEPSLVTQLVESGASFCPMCVQLLDGIRDENDEEELDTRITLQVAYLEDQVDKWNTKHL